MYSPYSLNWQSLKENINIYVYKCIKIAMFLKTWCFEYTTN